MTTRYKCKGCGSLDTIVELSLMPRTVVLRSLGPEIDDYDFGADDDDYESETVIGYACTVGWPHDCDFWDGNRAHPEGRRQTKWFRFQRAWDLEEIAEVVEE